MFEIWKENENPCVDQASKRFREFRNVISTVILSQPYVYTDLNTVYILVIWR